MWRRSVVAMRVDAEMKAEMHALLLTFALTVLPGQAVVDRSSFQPALVAPAATTMMYTQNAPPAQPPQINVEVNRGGRAWYASPVWIAIGAVALVVVILMIVMA